MPLILTVILIEILSGTEMDIFVPSLPEMQEIFNLSPFMVEFTVAANLAAHCIMAIFAGNLGDKYGQRIVMTYSMVLFIIGTLFCILAKTYIWMIIGRIIQGIGISGPAILAYTVVADNYSKKRQAEIMSWLNGAIVMAMAMAPVVGSYVSLYFHWQGNFYVMLFLAIISLIATLLFIPKSRFNPDKSISLKEYIPIIKNKVVMMYVLTIAITFLSWWLFTALGPILYIEDMGISLKEFGFYQGSACVIFSIGSFVSPYFLRKFGERKCFSFSVYGYIMFVIGVVLVILLGKATPITVTALICMMAIAGVLPGNLLYPNMLEVMPQDKGKVTAFFGAIRQILLAIVIQITSYFYSGNFDVIGIAMVIITLIMFVCFYKLFKVEKVFGE